MQVDKIVIHIKPTNIRLIIAPHTDKDICFDEADAYSYGESRYQLQEGREYEYEFVYSDDSPAQAHFQEKPGIVIPRRRPYEGTIKTGIYVGSMPLFVIDETTQREHKVVLEIQSIKTSYRRDYRTMLNDITSYYTDLVMLQGSPVTQKFEVDNDAPQQTLYQKFAFVKSIVDSEAFDEAIHKIIQNPVRSWKDTTVMRRMDNVRRLNRNEIRQIASRNDRIAYDKITGLNSVPRTIEVPYKCDTTDISENQFVKYVLTQFYNFCTDIAGKKNASDTLKNEARIVCNTLLRYIGTVFFKDISLPNHLNLNSPVLQRKEGYREILQGWLIFDLAAKLNWSGGDNVYEAGKRNVAALYEYWLFFRLLEVISSLFHISPEAKSSLVSRDKDQLNLDIKQGRRKVISGVTNSENRQLNIRFYYNRTFGHQEDIHSAGSWTMPMRPDYTLSMWPGEKISEPEAEKQEIIVHIHFDAKYRVNKILLDDQNSDVSNIEDENDPVNQELTKEKEIEELGEYAIGMYKRADLLKMHAYKDAIRRTSGAYILYPGTERSRKQGFHEIIPGLGAFCISPGNDSDQIAALKLFLIEVKRHMMDRASQREKMALQSYKIYKDKPIDSHRVCEAIPEAIGENREFQPDDTYVILGYYRSKNKNWIKNGNRYNGRIGERVGSIGFTPELISAKYVLLYSEQSDSIMFYKLKEGNRTINTKEDLVNSGYSARNKKTAYYLMFDLDPQNTEDEFKNMDWEINDIKNYVQSTGKEYEICTITLSELVRMRLKK